MEVDGLRPLPQPSRGGKCGQHEGHAYALKGLAARDGAHSADGVPGGGGGDNQPPDAAHDDERAGGVASGLRDSYVGVQAAARGLRIQPEPEPEPEP